MAEFELRETEPRDEAALNALYHRLTGIARTPAQYAWEWRDGPLGPAPSWVIVESKAGRVVGHHGVVPVPLVRDGQALTAARTENTMLDPDYRGRLMYHVYEAQLLRRLRDRYDVIFTTSGKGAWGAVRRRLGYREIGRWRSFTVGASAGYLGRRAISRLAPADIPGWLGSRRRELALETTDDPMRPAALWAESGRGGPGVHADRSADHLRWRLQRHPYHSHRMAVLMRGGRDEGFIAWREESGPADTVEVEIHDLFVRDAGAAALAECLAGFAYGWRGRPARLLLRTLDGDGALAEAARRVGPAILNRRSASDAAALLVHSNDQLVATRWSVTMLLAEGI